MPNHIHAIIILNDPNGVVGAGLSGIPPLPENIQAGTSPSPENTQTRPYLNPGALSVPAGLSGIPPLPEQITDGVTSYPENTQTRPNKRSPHQYPLSEIIRAWKSFSARRINLLRGTRGIPFWQRNYYEHIIRNEADYRRVYDYIQNNPSGWSEDQLNPNAPPEPIHPS